MYKLLQYYLAFIYLLLLLINTSLAAYPVYEAEDAEKGRETTIIQEELFASKKGVVRVKDGKMITRKTKPVHSDFKIDLSRPADLTFQVEVPKEGMYSVTSFATVDSKTAEYLDTARSKMDSISLMMSIDDGFPSSRVVVPSWQKTNCWKYQLGIFHFTSTKGTIRIWLPDGIIFDGIRLNVHRPPRIPDAAAVYKPAIVPSQEHPRLWVTPDSLPQLRNNMTIAENADVWKQIQKEASTPFKFKLPKDRTIEHNEPLLEYIQKNAFVWLITDNKMFGRRAIDLLVPYLERVDYGNMLDITRERGSAIYTGALVFDWCYLLLTEEEKKSIYNSQMRLVYGMEMGWPPFGQTIIIGHGNEGQLLRNMLAMSIAFYELDPIPYQFCSWRILEELVPMRRFEYQSSRHNQGIAYIGARLYWELLAAIMYKRMSGNEVFDPNIKTIKNYLLHMRLPNGEMFRDGDVYLSGPWWNYAPMALAMYSYGEDPVMKGEFLRQQRGRIKPSVLFLLLNNPHLKADTSFESLGCGYDSGKILCSQIIRTGWGMTNDSNDTVVEFKGGAYHFGNHQHGDSGAFQIYHRGILAADLGLYHFYGTEYDYNFNKRSISHNVMLVVDPNETFYRDGINDGGQRFVTSNPLTPERAVHDKMFKTGTLLHSKFFPSREKPEFTFFSVDLAPAYSNKVSDYVRSFCWIKTGLEKTPVAIVVFDRITSSSASFKKYWQLNTFTKPEQTPEGNLNALSIDTYNTFGLRLKRGKIQLLPLVPGQDKMDIELIGGQFANSIFGHKLTAPAEAPESTGWRIMISPKECNKTDIFLNVLLVGDEDAPSVPVHYKKNDNFYYITIADKSVTLNEVGKPVSFNGKNIEDK